MVSHSVIESALFSISGILWVRQERSLAPHPVLILDDVEDMVHGDFEWSEVDFPSVGLWTVSEARF